MNATKTGSFSLDPDIGLTLEEVLTFGIQERSARPRNIFTSGLLDTSTVTVTVTTIKHILGTNSRHGTRQRTYGSTSDLKRLTTVCEREINV